MLVLLIWITLYCWVQSDKNKDWLEEQRQFYFTRTWYWTHHPEEFEDDRIHFH